MVQQLVIQSEKGQDVTTSAIVAEVFGKRHADVLRDIKNLHCSDDFRRRNFAFIDNQAVTHSPVVKDVSCEMTKDGFSFLVMGYTGVKAGEFKEKFIAEFNKRTELLLNEDATIERAFLFLSRRTKALEEQVNFKTQQLELATQTIKEQAPMVKIYQDVISADNAHLASAMAQIFDMTPNKFNALLKQWKVIKKPGKEWVLCAKFQGKGYTKIHPVPYPGKDGNIKTKNELRWTEKGRLFLIDFFANKGYKTVNVAA